MKKILLFIVFCTLSSCDIFGEYYYSIQNNTQKKLKVQIAVHNDSLIEADSIIIQPNENIFIAKSYNGNSPADDRFQDSLSDISEIRIFYNGTRINKNFKLRGYWIYSEKDKYDANYHLIINDSI